MKTWRALIEQEMREHGETMADVEAASPPIGDWVDAQIYPGSWIVDGSPITIWTARHVYFAAGIDGDEWIASVSRHPDASGSELARWRR